MLAIFRFLPLVLNVIALVVFLFSETTPEWVFPLPYISAGLTTLYLVGGSIALKDAGVTVLWKEVNVWAIVFMGVVIFFGYNRDYHLMALFVAQSLLDYACVLPNSYEKHMKQ